METLQGLAGGSGGESLIDIDYQIYNGINYRILAYTTYNVYVSFLIYM